MESDPCSSDSYAGHLSDWESTFRRFTLVSVSLRIFFNYHINPSAGVGRNTDYLNLNFEFTISVVMAAQMINILPGFLRASGSLFCY